MDSHRSVSSMYHSLNYLHYPNMCLALKNYSKNIHNASIFENFFVVGEKTKNRFFQIYFFVVEKIKKIWIKLQFFFNSSFQHKFYKLTSQISADHDAWKKEKALNAWEQKNRELKEKIEALSEEIKRLELNKQALDLSIDTKKQALDLQEKLILNEGQHLGQLLVRENESQVYCKEVTTARETLLKLSKNLPKIKDQHQELQITRDQQQKTITQLKERLELIQGHLQVIEPCHTSQGESSARIIFPTIQSFFALYQKEMGAHSQQPYFLDKISADTEIRSWKCTSDGHYQMTLSQSQKSYSDQNFTIQGSIIRGIFPCAISKKNYAFEAFLTSVETVVNSDIRAILEVLVRQFKLYDALHCFSCDADGSYFLEMNREGIGWVPPFKENHPTEFGGAVLLLGTETSSKPFIRGILEKDKLIFTEGFSIYTYAPPLKIFKKLNIFEILWQSRQAIVTVIGLVLPIIGKQTIQKKTTYQRLMKSWSESAIPLEKKNYQVNYKEQYAHKKMSKDRKSA